MVFKEIVFENGTAVLRTSSVTKFNSEENKSKGYVLHKKIVNGYPLSSITFAYESDGAEGDDTYIMIPFERAMNLLRLEISTHKRDEKKKVDDFYNSLVISLNEIVINS